MKNIKILATLILFSAFSFYACNDKADARKQEAREQLELANPQTTQPNIPAPPTTPTTEPAQNAEGVWHYTCSNGCAGGAGAKGNCATCGNPLAHNAAYHSNNNSTATTNITPTQVTPPITPPTPPKVEPAQNAAGVWHYTCANGCAGGSGAKGNCSTCGGALAHNTAYHQ